MPRYIKEDDELWNRIVSRPAHPVTMHVRRTNQPNAYSQGRYLGLYSGKSIENLFLRFKELYYLDMYGRYNDSEEFEQDDRARIEEYSWRDDKEFWVAGCEPGGTRIKDSDCDIVMGIIAGDDSTMTGPDTEVDKYGFEQMRDIKGNIVPYTMDDKKVPPLRSDPIQYQSRLNK